MKKLILLSLAILLSNLTTQPKDKEINRNSNSFISEVKMLKSEWDIFTEALIQVESQGRSDIIGSKDDVGIFQITPVYLAECNRMKGYEYWTLEDRFCPEKSKEMFRWMNENKNPTLNIDKAIKIHNPRAGQSYKQKIVKQIEIIKQNEKTRFYQEV